LSESYDCFTVEQCCGGVLLCKCWDSHHGGSEYDPDYVVCNPMTGQWAALPTIVLKDEGNYLICFEPVDIFLGFDASVPSTFVVFVPLTNCLGQLTKMAIYSSETGRLTMVQNEWGSEILVGNSECVFLNGTMHLVTHHATVVTVDVEGKVYVEGI
jgi:hypothetical protein